MDQRDERLSDQVRALDFKELCAGHVDVFNQSRAIEADVRDRREVIEIRVARERSLQRRARREQVGVLRADLLPLRLELSKDTLAVGGRAHLPLEPAEL